MKLALLLALVITTHVRGNTHSTSVWRNHEAVGASVDGWVCYVTEAEGPECHPAVPRPHYREISLW